VRDAPSWRELLEGTLAAVVLTAVIGFLLAVLSGPWSLIAPSAFYFPLLLWLVSRCHPVFAAVAVFTIAGAIVWTTTHDIGRYGDPTQPIAIRVLAAQLVMLITTLAALVLAALFAERRKHEATIAERDAQLALAGKSALVGTFTLDVNTGKAQFSAGYAAIHGLPSDAEEGWRDEWMLVYILLIARNLINSATRLSRSDGASTDRSIAFSVRTANFGGSKVAPLSPMTTRDAHSA